jgi:hypothetical protein
MIDLALEALPDEDGVEAIRIAAERSPCIVKEQGTNSQHREPRLEEMLVDPIIKAVMAADGIDPRALEKLMRQTAALLQARRRPPILPANTRCDLRGDG